MKNRRHIYWLLLLIIPFYNTYGQTQERLIDSLSVYIKRTESGRNINYQDDKTLLSKLTKEDTMFLNILRKNETHMSYNVRAVVYYLYRTIGSLNRDTLFQQELNNHILRCCTDTTRAKNFAICNNIFSNYDKYFTKNDFDKTFKTHLATIVKSKKNEIEYNLVLFIGWLELKETIPYLKLLLEKGKNKEPYELAVYLALARMGDKEFIGKAIEKIKEKYRFHTRSIVEDREKYFSYVKQPEIVKVYIHALASKETFSEYDPFAESQRTTQDIACLALGNLMDRSKDLNNYILENHYDKKLYEQDKTALSKYGGEKAFHLTKYIDCSTNTYKAAKKWLLQKDLKYVFEFDRSKYY